MFSAGIYIYIVLTSISTSWTTVCPSAVNSVLILFFSSHTFAVVVGVPGAVIVMSYLTETMPASWAKIWLNSLGVGVGARVGVGVGVRAGVGVAVGVLVGVGPGVGVGVGVSAGTGVGVGVGVRAGVAVAAGVGVRPGVGVPEVDVGAAVGAGVSTGAGVGVDVTKGKGVGVEVGVGSAVGRKTKNSPMAIRIRRTRIHMPGFLNTIPS